MSAITAYYLNEMNDKLQGISDALANLKIGIAEWKKSTGTIPASELADKTLLFIIGQANYSSGAQTALSVVPIATFDTVGSGSDERVPTGGIGTQMNFYSAYIGEVASAYPKLSIGSNGDGTVEMINVTGTYVRPTFYYTTL